MAISRPGSWYGRYGGYTYIYDIYYEIRDAAKRDFPFNIYGIKLLTGPLEHRPFGGLVNNQG